MFLRIGTRERSDGNDQGRSHDSRNLCSDELVHVDSPVVAGVLFKRRAGYSLEINEQLKE